MNITGLLIGALFAAGVGVACAHAETTFDRLESGKLAIGQVVATPKGYYDMCLRRPGICKIVRGRLPVSSDGSVALTPATMRQLENVNAEINAAIRPSRREDWGAGESVGDCKEFALSKQQKLVRMGWPSSAVRAAIVRTSSGEKHMTLVVRTSNGDFVLDNLSSRVLPWRSAPYTWEKIQSTSDMWRWNSL